MKISFNKTAVGIMAAIMAMAAGVLPANAEGTTTDVQVSASTSVTVEATSTNAANPAKLPLRDKINDRMEKIRENSAQNRDQRNKIIEERIAEVKDIRTDARADMKAEKGDKEARKDTMTKMRHDVFVVRRDAIVKQLSHSIENLQNIKARIDTRITKIKADGKDTVEAEKLLIIATGKIAAAKVSVAALAAIVPPANATASSSASAEMDLAKPRVLAEAAVKSVREARDAFKDVVESIAKSMGREVLQKKVSAQATSTISASSTNQ